MFKFLDQSVGILFIGCAVGAAFGFLSTTLQAIVSIASPVAIGLFVAFSLSTVLLDLKLGRPDGSRYIGIGTAAVVGAYFTLTVMGEGQPSAQTEQIRTLVTTVLPWAPVGFSCFRALPLWPVLAGPLLTKYGHAKSAIGVRPSNLRGSSIRDFMLRVVILDK